MASKFNLRSAGRLAAVLLLAAGMAACTLIGRPKSDEHYDYRTAQPRQGPLEVPPDLSQLPHDDRYALPEARSASTAGAPAAAPATTGVASGAEVVAPRPANARIEREGVQRWLAVDVPPEQAYARIKAYWPSIGLPIRHEEPAAGVIETEWADRDRKPAANGDEDLGKRLLGLLRNLESSGERERYIARVERRADNGSEIYISWRGEVEVYTTPNHDNVEWSHQGADSNAEAAMLQRLALQFGGPAVPAPVAAPAGTAAPLPGKAAASSTAVPEKTVQSNLVHKLSVAGAPGLQIDEAFDRAWRRVGLALDRGGFTVEDRDRTKGIFFVRYLDPDYEARERDKRGFFGRLFNSDAKVAAQQFRIAVTAAGEGTTVAVQDKDGKPDAGATAERIVSQIKEQML